MEPGKKMEGLHETGDDMWDCKTNDYKSAKLFSTRKQEQEEWGEQPDRGRDTEAEPDREKTVETEKI